MIISNRLPIGYIFRLAGFKVLLVTIFSTVIYLISIPYDVSVSFSIPTMLGTAISLLLAFKLSQSYDRWWEARKIWGTIVNDSRTLMIQLKGFVTENPEKNNIIEAIILRQIAFCYALGDKLRGLDAYASSKDYLMLDGDKELAYHHNLPLLLMEKHEIQFAELKRKLFINEYQEVRLNETVSRLIDSMGMAERIKKTVFPTPYRIFHDLFIYLFLIMLSFSITEFKGI